MFLITGLIIGVICGVAIGGINKSNSFNSSHDHNFITLENIFEQYMSELNQKQEEIVTLITKFEIKQKQQKQAEQSIVEQPSVKSRPSKKQPSVPPNQNSKRELVLDLLAKGHDQEQIAQRLGIGKGEVQLIAQLKNSKNTIDY